MSTYQIKYGDSLSSIARSAGMSTQDILRLNPSISDPNKIYAGRTLNLSATPAPAPTGPSEALKDLSIKNSPTIAEVASRVPDFVEDPTLTKLGKTYKTEATSPVDEGKIRRETRDRFQGQIDAINQIYEGKRAEARVQGTARQGTTNAINARSGLLGSDFGVANTNNTEAYNNDILGTIDSEKGAKINDLYALIHKDATSAIAAKRAAIEAGATKYLEYLATSSSKKKEAATNIAKALFAKGIDPATLTAEEMSKITSTYGMTGEEFSNIYNDTKTAAETAKAKAEADALKANSFDLSDGQAKYYKDPVTGETKLLAENNKNFAPNKYSSGGGISNPNGSGSGGTGGPKTPSNPSGFLDYYDPNFTMTSLRQSKGGRFLTQGELKPITDIQQVVGQASNLTNLINTVDTGPFIGIIKSNNPYDTKAQAMKAAITAIVPKLARGVYGEVGVLTDQDIANYSRTIANLKNTADVNKAVMAMTLDIATRSLSNNLNSLSAGGRDVSKFEPIYSGMNKKATELKGSIGYGDAPATNIAPAGKMVKVKNPNTGQVITIPEANLSKALGKGYVQQ